MNDDEKLRRALDVQVGNLPDPEETPDGAKVCDVRYGDRVLIEWGGLYDGIVDSGYLMGLPSHQEDDANLGGVVHIPNPENPGGIGEAGEQTWVTLRDLSCNPFVKAVRKEG